MPHSMRVKARARALAAERGWPAWWHPDHKEEALRIVYRELGLDAPRKKRRRRAAAVPVLQEATAAPPAPRLASCVICLEHADLFTLAPCGHQCLCKSCVDMLGAHGTCPLCRADIESAVATIYTV